jgi:alkanesulfonate monooxygenase SsuD/methylene tetrahydromethanopterin reductase-like flavin-dependent oxidoreductase (luciferase family)
MRFADEYNTPYASVEQARDRRRLLDEAARAGGRDPLRFSMMTGCILGRDDGEVRDRVRVFGEKMGATQVPPLVGTVEQVAESLRRYEAVGVERAMLQHLVHEDVEMVSLLGELAAALS